MIYLDNAASTKPADEVIAAMQPFLQEAYGNPSAIYRIGRKSRDAIDHARSQTARLIDAQPEEIFFTSGGTESDNWALIAGFESQAEKGNHIITTRIEHHAILNTCKYLETSRGAHVTYVDVHEDGIVDPDDIQKAITPQTVLISVMTANNEIGTIQPIREIGQIAKQNNILFHTDAVQAYGHIPLDVHAMNIDLLSASSHKIHGPKGAGILYIKKGVKFPGFIHGGSQERQRRSGTENVASIVGMGTAAELALKAQAQNDQIIRSMRDHMLNRILNEIPDVHLNGSLQHRLPNNINVSFNGIDVESLLIRLDLLGIAASSGAACTSGSLTPSHVLLALGLPPERSKNALRLSLSIYNTKDEINTVVDKLKMIVSELRK